MVSQFTEAMKKLATVAQDTSKLIDCSEVIPVPATVKLPPPTLPAGMSMSDIQASVGSSMLHHQLCLTSSVVCRNSLPEH